MRFNYIYRVASVLAMVASSVCLGIGIFHAIPQETVADKTAETLSAPTQASLVATTSDAKAEIPHIYTSEEKSTPAANNTNAAPAKTTTVSTAANELSIVISGRSTPIFTTADLGTNPGAGVALYDGQFLFAHSSGPFSTLGSADGFQIVQGDSVASYKIVKTITYCDYSNAQQHGIAYSCDNYAEPKLPTLAYGDVGNYYDAGAFGYDLVLMTCAGEYLPGQDATHRLLAYAVLL